MFLARRISNFLANSTAASEHVPVILRSSSSNDSTRMHSNRVQWTRDVEVKEIPRLVKCGKGYRRGCNKGFYKCQCVRRKQIYNGHMKATFVTYASQIASEVPPPQSLTSRIMNYITESIVADAALTNAAATVPSVIVDTDTSTGTIQRRSKRTRQQSSDVEPIGNEAEEYNVEFEAVDAPFVAEDEEVTEEIVTRAPENARMLKEIECSLDGVYWAAIGRRIRRKSDIFVPAM